MIHATYRIKGGDWQRIASFDSRKTAVDTIAFQAAGREWYMSQELSDVQRVFEDRQTEADTLKIFLSGSRLVCLSIRGIEETAGLPNDTLRNWLEGKRGLPAKYIKPVIEALERLCWRNW